MKNNEFYCISEKSEKSRNKLDIATRERFVGKSLKSIGPTVQRETVKSYQSQISEKFHSARYFGKGSGEDIDAHEEKVVKNYTSLRRVSIDPNIVDEVYGLDKTPNREQYAGYVGSKGSKSPKGGEYVYRSPRGEVQYVNPKSRMKTSEKRLDASVISNTTVKDTKGGILNNSKEVVNTSSFNLKKTDAVKTDLIKNPFFQVNEFTNRLVFDYLLDNSQQVKELRDNISGRLKYIGLVDAGSDLPNGKGIQYNKDGTIIQGIFKAGNVHGIATKYEPNGVVKISKGNFIGDKMTGYGKIYHPNGRLEFKGEFKEDVIEKKGILMDEDGNKVYDGEFWDGKYHGTGNKYYINGDVYHGKFSNGLRHGDGQMDFADGSIIKGCWKNGKLERKYSEIGILKDEKNKILYRGDIKDNKANGTGKQFLDNDEVYEGEFFDNLKHGKGKLMDKHNNLIYEGFFVKGIRSGFGNKFHDNGMIRVAGLFQKGKLNGRGKQFDNTGKLLYKGWWKNDQKDGRGTYYYMNGERYKGLWRNDKRNGIGAYYYKTGNFYEGFWVDDKFDESGKFWSHNAKEGKYGRIETRLMDSHSTMHRGDTYYRNKSPHGSPTKRQGNVVDNAKVNSVSQKKKAPPLIQTQNMQINADDFDCGDESENDELSNSNLVSNEELAKQGLNEPITPDNLQSPMKPAQSEKRSGNIMNSSGNNIEASEISLMNQKKVKLGVSDEKKTNSNLETPPKEKGGPESGHYEGELKNGKRSGRGVLYYTNGNIEYDGNWFHGKKYGAGTYNYSDGSVYEGDWIRDKRNGKGTLTYQTGDRFEGEWENDQKQGFGVYYYNDGDVYEGLWRGGVRHGDGTYRYFNADRYEGNWIKGQKTGHGKYFHKTGNLEYTGEWLNGLKDGNGTYYYENGDKYNGQWKMGLKHGKGIYDFKDKDLYNGDWIMGKKDGQGNYVCKNGDSYEGAWKDDMRDGEGTYKFIDGDSYEGMWRQGLKHGLGTFTFNEGNKYAGEWECDKRSGNGVHYYKSGGKYYEGQWKNDMKHGYGISYDTAGNPNYEGIWRNDKKAAHGK